MAWGDEGRGDAVDDGDEELDETVSNYLIV